MAKMWQDFCARFCLAAADRRRLVRLLALLALGLGLMLGAEAMGGAVRLPETKAETGAAVPMDVVQREGTGLEEQLVEILGQIDGAGRVSVTLTYADSGQMEYAVNVNSTLRQTEEQTDGEKDTSLEEVQSREVVLVDGNREALVQREVGPRVQGVLVVADGAGDANVCRVMTDAVVGLLGVPTHRVVVCQRQR